MCVNFECLNGLPQIKENTIIKAFSFLYFLVFCTLWDCLECFEPMSSCFSFWTQFPTTAWCTGCFMFFLQSPDSGVDQRLDESKTHLWSKNKLIGRNRSLPRGLCGSGIMRLAKTAYWGGGGRVAKEPPATEAVWSLCLLAASDSLRWGLWWWRCIQILLKKWSSYFSLSCSMWSKNLLEDGKSSAKQP